MEWERELLRELGIDHKKRTPIPTVVGPLLGLAYIIAFPVLGIPALVLAGSCRIVRALLPA